MPLHSCLLLQKYILSTSRTPSQSFLSTDCVCTSPACTNTRGVIAHLLRHLTVLAAWLLTLWPYFLQLQRVSRRISIASHGGRTYARVWFVLAFCPPFSAPPWRSALPQQKEAGPGPTTWDKEELLGSLTRPSLLNIFFPSSLDEKPFCFCEVCGMCACNANAI